MKALITGGAGFAGWHLARYLLAQGYEVIVMARAGNGRGQHLLPQVRLERADLRDFERVRQLLGEIRPERIYHLAAFSSVTDSFQEPRECYSVNFGGTLNLLEAWREFGFETRVLVVSSSDVYGRVDEADLPLREDSPLHPVSPYGTSKAATELLAVQFGLSYGLPVVRARPFHHTGPHQSCAFVCSDLARQVAEAACGHRRPILLAGNTGIRRDFSDVRDIVRGYALLLEKGRLGEVYQLCSGGAISVREIIDVLAAKLTEPFEVRVDASKVRSGESPARWGDPAKARSEVGWEPEYTLEKTLGDLEGYWEGQIREAEGRRGERVGAVRV